MLKTYKSFMKKIVFTFLVLVFIISLSSTALANEGFEYTVDPRVRVSSDGTAEFEIHVTGIDVYAGAQFELILSEGVSIENVAFDKGSGFSSIPPTYARGSYFFSLIAGTNEYEGDFTCTVEILYDGTEPAQIVIAEIQTYYIVEPGNVDAAINDTRKVIEILPFDYVVIGEEPPPLTQLVRDWMWPIIAGVAIIIIILIAIILRQQRKIKAASNSSSSETLNKGGEKLPEQTEDHGEDIQDTNDDQ